ncbi:Fic family protein [Candidatus Saccharibacteria bacterium]|nr:Fic family protein [Candidatus Saccharibacteria bacterium]
MHEIPDKYHLSREDNILLAKKYLKDSIYRSAFLEGIAVTFPQTAAILENATVNNVPAKDIAKVFELRDVWEYVLNNLDNTIDLAFLQELHQIIAKEDVPWNRLGVLRTEQVRISGTNYMPPLPNANSIHQAIKTITDSTATDTDKAITLMLYIMRTQPFLDGNKRVGTMIANKILISTGHGIFSLPPEQKEPFVTNLVTYYETGNMDNIKQLIFDYCLTGW